MQIVLTKAIFIEFIMRTIIIIIMIFLFSILCICIHVAECDTLQWHGPLKQYLDIIIAHF